MSFFKRIFSSEKKDESLNEQEKQSLDKGLEKSKTTFFSKLSKAVAGKSKVDDEVLDNLEEILVSFCEQFHWAIEVTKIQPIIFWDNQEF